MEFLKIGDIIQIGEDKRFFEITCLPVHDSDRIMISDLEGRWFNVISVKPKLRNNKVYWKTTGSKKWRIFGYNRTRLSSFAEGNFFGVIGEAAIKDIRRVGERLHRERLRKQLRDLQEKVENLPEEPFMSQEIVAELIRGKIV